MAVGNIVANASKASGSQLSIGDTATDNGDGTFSVSATATSNGTTYYGTILVEQSGASFQILDASYLGFSGVDYLGGQIQQQIGGYSSNTPVTDWVNAQMANSSYIACP